MPGKTRKQLRSERRIELARRKKEAKFRQFLQRLARRKFPDAMQGFCCYPRTLGMTLDKFLSHGTHAGGGNVIYFEEGQLQQLLPDNWECSEKWRACVFTRTYLTEIFDADGTWADNARADGARL